MAKNNYAIGYNKDDLEYQPSMNTLQSNYDMYMKIEEIKSNPQKFKSFIGNVFDADESPFAALTMLDILPNIFDIDEETYFPRVENENENYLGMEGSYNLNSINRFMNGGKPKMRPKERALNPLLQVNKYYSNNY